MPARIDILDIGALRSFRSRFRRSGETVKARLRRADSVVASVVSAVDAVVTRRDQVLSDCLGDPEADCSGQRRALEEARAARSRLQAAVGQAQAESRPVLAGVNHRHPHADSYMSEVISGVGAVKGPASKFAGGVGGAALAGAAAIAVGGMGGSAPIGSLGPSATREMEDDLFAWSGARGAALNQHLRDGDALSSEEATLAEGLDLAMEHATPTSGTVTLDRGVGREFLGSLGISPYASDTNIVDRLNGGRVPVVRDPGFLAVSSDLSPHFAAKPVRLHVEVPPGSKIVDLRGSRRLAAGPMSAHPIEHELLLPRGGYLSVSPGSARLDGGTIHVHVRYVPRISHGT